MYTIAINKTRYKARRKACRHESKRFATHRLTRTCTSNAFVETEQQSYMWEIDFNCTYAATVTWQ